MILIARTKGVLNGLVTSFRRPPVKHLQVQMLPKIVAFLLSEFLFEVSALD